MILVNCNNVTVKNCGISGAYVGVETYLSFTCIITNNSIEDCRYGVLGISSYLEIMWNNISNNEQGIALWASGWGGSYAKICYNNMVGNKIGVSGDFMAYLNNFMDNEEHAREALV